MKRIGVKGAGIGQRLALAFGAVTLLVVGLAGFGVWRLAAQNGAVQNMLAHEFKGNDLAGNLVVQALAEVSALGQAVMADGIDGIQRGLKEADKSRAEADSAHKEMTEALRGEAALAALKTVDATQAPYRAAMDKVVAAIKGGDTDAARIALNEKGLRAAQDAYLHALRSLERLESEEMDAAQAAAAASYATARNAMVVAAVVCAALAIALGMGITRSLTRPAAQAVEVASRIADGDLTQDVPAHGSDEMGRMLDALQAMQASLRRVVGGVRSGSDGIATASHEIASGNQNLSQRTEEQASALQQTAASMEQLGSTVRQNADNAREADRLARAANEVARSGGSVVGEVVDTMKGIHDSSRRIADIIAVIDGIAFQTNILALNAAVEAARAGEQGRGFAVVAGEVRSLAQRSAEAAREIKTLIGASVERVEKGTALVDRAGATMQEVVGSIERVTAIVGEISSASAEQSSGVSQVGDAVSQMDKATQQNAALVEQSAAAAESLSDQARALVQAVAVFRLRADSGTS